MNINKLFILLIVNVAVVGAKTPCTFKNMVGECPTRACAMRDALYFVNQQKQNDADSAAPQTDEDRAVQREEILKEVLLHGRTRNGKSMQVYEAARESGTPVYVFVKKNLTELTDEQNRDKMQEHIDQALEETEPGIVPIVLFEELDLMDQYAIDFFGETVDKGEYKGNVQFVFTTNKFDKLDPSFADRFKSDEGGYYNPGEERRRELLDQFYRQQSTTLSYLSDDQLEYLVGRTEGFNVCLLKELARDLVDYGEDATLYKYEKMAEIIEARRKKIAEDENKKKWWEEHLGAKDGVDGKVSQNNPFFIDEDWNVWIKPQR